MSEQPRKIGVLGGTFDPPHRGHLELARAAMRSLELDEVLFIPVYRNPLKDRKATPAKQRMEMVELLIRNDPSFAISDIEVSRKGFSYMSDTLFELTYARPGDYWLIVGSDSLTNFDEWKNWRRILKMARLAVAVRPPQTERELKDRVNPELAERVDWIQMEPDPVSSTDIRLRIDAARQPYESFLTPEVLNYMQANKLYRNK